MQFDQLKRREFITLVGGVAARGTRAGGVDMPVANAALMVFHIPMRERYIASLQGATAASLGLPELRPLRHRVTILPRQRPGSKQFSSLSRLLWVLALPDLYGQRSTCRTLRPCWNHWLA